MPKTKVYLVIDSSEESEYIITAFKTFEKAKALLDELKDDYEKRGINFIRLSSQDYVYTSGAFKLAIEITELL